MKKKIFKFSKSIIITYLVINLFFINIQYLIAQISWHSAITIPQNDTVLLNKKIEVDKEINSNFFKTSNPSNQLLQQINIPDITIEDVTNITHSENSVFISPIDPDIIANSNNFSTWPTIANLSTSGQVSINAGQNWDGVVGNLNNSRADPAVTIGLNGRIYAGYVDLSFGQSISYSDDNGQNWIERVVAPNPGQVADKNHLWIDNRHFRMDGTVNPHDGNLYSAWTDFGNLNNSNLNIVISISTDDGDTWTTPVNLSDDVGAGSHDQGVNIQTGPNGEVYVCINT